MVAQTQITGLLFPIKRELTPTSCQVRFIDTIQLNALGQTHLLPVMQRYAKCYPHFLKGQRETGGALDSEVLERTTSILTAKDLS